MKNTELKRIRQLLIILIGAVLLQTGIQSPIGTETEVGAVVGMIAFYVGISLVVWLSIAIIFGGWNDE